MSQQTTGLLDNQQTHQITHKYLIMYDLQSCKPQKFIIKTVPTIYADSSIINWLLT